MAQLTGLKNRPSYAGPKEENEDMTNAMMQTAKTTEITQKDVDIERTGKKIIVPEGMTYAEAREWLARKQKSEEEEVSVSEVVRAFPLDGAYAFMKALKEIYGWVSAVPTPSFFGKSPPQMLSVEIGVGQNTQVVWGRIEVPNIDGYLQTAFTVEGLNAYFRIAGVVKRKSVDEVTKIANLTRKFAREESIYKGQAIRMSFPEDMESLDITETPKFFDTAGVREEELIFPKHVFELVSVNLFTPIEKTAQCREHQIPLKRGILLEGPYGVGKTLTADVTAKKAVANGWTFIYLEEVSQLKQAIHFAQQYSPAVIFAEDIDSAVSGERDDDMNDILNTIDGVDTKHAEVMVVLTTNHVDKINKAMIRPGRLDAVVPVRPPDAEAAARLVRLYARNLLDEGEDISEACSVLDGQIPAVIREVVERSKLGAIRRSSLGGGDLTLKGEDLFISANGMMAHLELMKAQVEDDRSDEEKAMSVLVEGIKDVAGRLLPLKEVKSSKSTAALNGAEA